MDELKALGELLLMLVMHPGTGVLIALLLVAAVIDWRTYRIPNWLTLSGLAWGIVFNATNATSVPTGLVHAGLGLLTGLLLLLPLYALRVMGAGDVKLMAMVGAFIGAGATFKAALIIFILGGIAALALSMVQHTSGRLVTNLRDIAYSMALRGVPLWRPGNGNVSVGRLPYGLCISVGAILFLVLRQVGYL
jgi:prepilin peptidase CpaA